MKLLLFAVEKLNSSLIILYIDTQFFMNLLWKRMSSLWYVWWVYCKEIGHKQMRFLGEELQTHRLIIEFLFSLLIWASNLMSVAIDFIVTWYCFFLFVYTLRQNVGDLELVILILQCLGYINYSYVALCLPVMYFNPCIKILFSICSVFFLYETFIK